MPSDSLATCEAADPAAGRPRALGGRVEGRRPARVAGHLDAEYVALTRLHADALITVDRQLADAVKDLVTIAPIEVLY